MLLPFVGIGQNDSLAYNTFKDKLVVYGDVGFSTAPFSIKTKFSDVTDKLKYRNNFKLAFGLGIAYKWFGLRLGISAFNMLPNDHYGKSKQFNIGFDFTLKRFYYDIDLRLMQGYAIKNAYQWDNNLNEETPHSIHPNITSASFSFNSWYFNNSDFKISAIKGIKGNYKKQVHTWYIKGTLNYFGAFNSGEGVIPFLVSDSMSSKSFSSYFSATDFGAMPGYAYVNRINNWQFAACFGFGPVIQIKSFEINNENRGFLGLAPRYDVKLLGGYNTEKWFMGLITDFDNKSISFNDVRFNQFFYTIRLTGGYRFDVKKKEKKSKKK